MMLFSRYGFGMIHIPKNGGSSVRDQLRDYDEFEQAFHGIKTHPEIGVYDASHVPLERLRRYFPEAFARIAEVETYAVTRDPYARFVSALAQRSRMIKGRHIWTLTPEEVRDEIDCVMAHLSDTPEFPDHQFSHFTRQSVYIELDGSQFVTRLFPLERIHEMIQEFEQRMGIALISDFHANKSVEFKNPTLAAPVIVAKDVLKKILPPRAIHRLRELALGALTTKGADAIERQVYDSKEVAGFIETHYADDFRLYQASTQRGAAVGVG